MAEDYFDVSGTRALHSLDNMKWFINLLMEILGALDTKEKYNLKKEGKISLHIFKSMTACPVNTHAHSLNNKKLYTVKYICTSLFFGGTNVEYTCFYY